MKKIHKEIILVFLRMGTVAFGGPAAHTAMMEEELVSKREWMTKKEFLDLMGFTNLIPGPNSTELAILIGYKMGGRLELFLAGASFILPAMLIVMAIGFFYRSFGHLPAIQNVFAFIQPVVVAVIAQALWKLSRNALKGIPTYLVLFLGLGLLLTGLNEISTLLICGAAYWLLNKFSESRKSNFAIEPMSLGLLFLTFLKIGSFLYGSGICGELPDSDSVAAPRCRRGRRIHAGTGLHDSNVHWDPPAWRSGRHIGDDCHFPTGFPADFLPRTAIWKNSRVPVSLSCITGSEHRLIGLDGICHFPTGANFSRQPASPPHFRSDSLWPSEAEDSLLLVHLGRTCVGYHILSGIKKGQQESL